MFKVNKILKKNEKKDDLVKQKERQSAQKWINVEDIDSTFLHRRDKKILAYIKIEPINIDLFSDNERNKIVRALYSVLNGIKRDYQWLSLGKSVDLDSYISDLNQQLTSTDSLIKKKILNSYIEQAVQMASGGQTLERDFYMIFSSDVKDNAEIELLGFAKELCSSFESAGLSASICYNDAILNLLFSFFNPLDSRLDKPNLANIIYPPVLYEGAE